MSDSIKIEEAARASASGYYIPNETETTHNVFCKTPKSKSAVYDAYRAYIFENYPTNEWGAPIATKGISIESSDDVGLLWTGRVRYEVPTTNEAASAEASSTGGSGGGTGGGSSNSSTVDYLASSFSTSGSTVNKTVGLLSTYYGPDGEIESGVLGAPIGVTPDGDVTGVSVVAPSFTFDLERRFPAATFFSQAPTIANLTGTINAKQFHGFAVGTVLFQGATSGSLQQKTDEQTGRAFFYWQCSLSFAVSPNVTLNLGNGIVVNKPGWAALDPRCIEGADGSPVITGAYVHQVYPYGDFTLLGVV